MTLDKETYDDLVDSSNYDYYFTDKLKQVAPEVEARKVTFYQYYLGGDFVGDSWNNTYEEILDSLDIERGEN